MERDIRKLFENESLDKKLPKHHREEFYAKLNTTSISKTKKTSFLVKIAISAVVLVMISGYFFINKTEKNTQTTLFAEMQKVEKEYLKNIDKEWNNFLELTNDKKLINKYEEKLNLLEKQYKKWSLKFNKEPNNIEVLESLITNLQERLRTLKEIQEHIKSLDQKNKSYETIVI